MLTPIADLIAHICAAMTLRPEDAVLTGTPAGTGLLKAGDLVTVTIDGLGPLTNPVIAETPKSVRPPLFYPVSP
jgi:2-keto-4-pentenoate hydratase/2-oxohepta-3-ene-1,7-dioic acid hydratase in catechol pathway